MRLPLLILLVLLLFLFTGPAAADVPFVHEVANPGGFVGTFCSLALDRRGDPHMVYWDISNQFLVYTAKKNGAWSYEVVEATGFVGQHTSIALDDNDVPHVSFVNSTFANNILRYAVRSGGSWTTETVDPGPDNVGTYNSIAVDELGRPHITYYNASTADLLYAVKNGVWSLETALSTDDVGAYTSLALDGQGRPHVAFRNLGLQRLVYGVKDAGVWTFEDVKVVGNPGYWNSIALDAQGHPRISYYDDENGLEYAARIDDVWVIEGVTDQVSQEQTSLALDAGGVPHISFYDGGITDDLRYAVRADTGWVVQTVDATGDVGIYNSIAVDPEGNPKIGYHDQANGDLKFTDSSIQLLAPTGGETWPVGSSRAVEWTGAGVIDVLLSVDGGNSFSVLAQDIFGGGDGTGGIQDLLVPHQPSRFCLIQLRRNTPFSTATSDSFFTIEADVSLLMLSASILPGNSGVLLSWETEPGPGDLAGYRIERSPVGQEVLRVVASLVRETLYTDPDGAPGMRYRLSSVNGLGDALILGETVVAPRAALSAWPLPYRTGKLTVLFLTASSLGGEMARAEVAIFDLEGRQIRTLVQGNYRAGIQTTTWDGRDATGRPVPQGVYFLRLRSAGQSARIKLVVVG